MECSLWRDLFGEKLLAGDWDHTMRRNMSWQWLPEGDHPPPCHVVHRDGTELPHLQPRRSDSRGAAQCATRTYRKTAALRISTDRTKATLPQGVAGTIFVRSSAQGLLNSMPLTKKTCRLHLPPAKRVPNTRSFNP